MKRKSHRQSWVKVNAPVDYGVVGIVEALSKFDSLETLESCEGNGNDSLWVCFRYGRYFANKWRDASDFIFAYFAPKLMHRVGDSATITVRQSASGSIVASISVRREAKEEVEKAIREIASEFTASRRHN